MTVLEGFSPISTLFVVQFRLEILFALSAGRVIYARPWGIKPAVECTSTQREREIELERIVILPRGWLRDCVGQRRLE